MPVDYPGAQMPPHYMQGNTNQSSNASAIPNHVQPPHLGSMGSPQRPSPSPNPSTKSALNDSTAESADENGPVMANGIDGGSLKDEESNDSNSNMSSRQVRLIS